MIQTLSALGSGHSMDPFLQAPLCRALRIRAAPSPGLRSPGGPCLRDMVTDSHTSEQKHTLPIDSCSWEACASGETLGQTTR